MTEILIGTNIALIFTILIATFIYQKRKDKIKKLNEQLLDAKLMNYQAPKLMAQKELQYQQMLYTLAKAMKSIREADQDVGALKKDLGRFYSDLILFSKMSNEVINDKEAYGKIIDYFENDLGGFLSNKTDRLNTDKFFEIVEQIELKQPKQ